MKPPAGDNPVVLDYETPVGATPGRVPMANRVVSGIAGIFFALMFAGYVLSAVVDRQRDLFPAAMIAGDGAAFSVLCHFRINRKTSRLKPEKVDVTFPASGRVRVSSFSQYQCK